MMSTDDYVTTGQAAEELGVSVKLIQQWIDEGTLPGERYPTTRARLAAPRRRVLRKDLEQFKVIHRFGQASSSQEIAGND